jgi:hypothetical protein
MYAIASRDFFQSVKMSLGVGGWGAVSHTTRVEDSTFWDTKTSDKFFQTVAKTNGFCKKSTGRGLWCQHMCCVLFVAAPNKEVVREWWDDYTSGHFFATNKFAVFSKVCEAVQGTCNHFFYHVVETGFVLLYRRTAAP